MFLVKANCVKSMKWHRKQAAVLRALRRTGSGSNEAEQLTALEERTIQVSIVSYPFWYFTKHY